jgi:hypothetical protein
MLTCPVGLGAPRQQIRKMAGEGAMEQADGGAKEVGATSSRTKQSLALLVFSLGVICAMGLSAIAVLGDVEATLFDSGLAHMRDAALTLRCPTLITAGETGTVAASFKNPLDKPVEFSIRTHISQYVPMWREINSKVSVDPGDRESLEWTVTADDAVQGNLILVKVLRYRKYPLPGRLGSCGILVVDLPYLSGRLIAALIFTASLTGLVGGTLLWILGSQPLVGRALDLARAMGVLATTLLAGLVASLLGAWLLGLLFWIAAVLLIGAILGHFLHRNRKPQA